MKSRTATPRCGLTAAAVDMALACLGLPTAAQAPAEGAVTAKDVVLDSAAVPAGTASSPVAQPGGRLVATPTQAAPVQSPAAIYTTAMHDSSTAAALADLGLALLRQGSLASGQAEVNALVSPISVASALGMVHAGTAGESARELAALMAPATAGDQGFAWRLPSVLDRLRPAAANGSPATAGPTFTMANRVWINKAVASSLPAPFAAMVTQRFKADAAVLSFDNANAARQAINQWTDAQTLHRIPELLPAGSITPTTRVVVTNAVHFKSPWALPFNPAATEPRAFNATQGVQMVPTMIDERNVARGIIDNLSVLELPFADKAYSLMIAMPPKGHSLDGLEKDLAGLDLTVWSSQLKESTCRLELPKFAIASRALSIKAALQALGVRTVFTDQADLRPMLGAAARGVHMDDVYHSATITIDELGGEASAATAATMVAKSFSLPTPACAVDRPFVFAVVHKPTGAPLFVGKIANPSNPN